MSHVRRINGTFRPNFLESEVGLVLKTYQISASLGTEDGFGNKIVAAGTVYPSNDGSAVGIVFENVDVTWGDHEGSIMLAGRVLKDRLDVQSAAETTLKSSGIVFVDAPEVTRGYTVTYEKDDGTGTPPVDHNEYSEGSYAPVSTEYPLTKVSNTQTGWATSSGGDAVTSVKMTADVKLYPVWTPGV